MWTPHTVHHVEFVWDLIYYITKAVLSVYFLQGKKKKKGCSHISQMSHQKTGLWNVQKAFQCFFDPLKNIICPSQQQINRRGKACLVKIKKPFGWKWAVWSLWEEMGPLGALSCSFPHCSRPGTPRAQGTAIRKELALVARTSQGGRRKFKLSLDTWSFGSCPSCVGAQSSLCFSLLLCSLGFPARPTKLDLRHLLRTNRINHVLYQAYKAERAICDQNWNSLNTRNFTLSMQSDVQIRHTVWDNIRTRTLTVKASGNRWTRDHWKNWITYVTATTGGDKGRTVSLFLQTSKQGSLEKGHLPCSLSHTQPSPRTRGRRRVLPALPGKGALSAVLHSLPSRERGCVCSLENCLSVLKKKKKMCLKNISEEN